MKAEQLMKLQLVGATQVRVLQLKPSLCHLGDHKSYRESNLGHRGGNLVSSHLSCGTAYLEVICTSLQMY
jgi:hypothetical protein